MSFVRDFHHPPSLHPKFGIYPFTWAKREQGKHALYFRLLADEQSINVGKRSPLVPPTTDQAFFYPVLYESN